jgi:hypothetical protein
MKKFFDSVINNATRTGLVGAEIRILDTVTKLKVPIYSENDPIVANEIDPLLTDAEGNFEFFVQDGKYDLQIIYQGNTIKTIIEFTSDDPVEASLVNQDGGTLKNVTIESGTISPDVDFQGDLSTGTVDSESGQDEPLSLAFNKRIEVKDLSADWVITGLLPATSASLTSDISVGTGIAGGVKLSKDITPNTYSNVTDTYVDIDSSGAYIFNEVANGAGAPPVAAGTMRLAKVVTDATSITSVEDLRVMNPLLTALYYYDKTGTQFVSDEVTDVLDEIDVLLGDLNPLKPLRDYDRSPLFIDVEDFTAGPGPHVITVPASWDPTNPDVRFWKRDVNGVITEAIISATTATDFTVNQTLVATDVIFIGDDKNRNIHDGDPADIRNRLSVYSKAESDNTFLQVANLLQEIEDLGPAAQAEAQENLGISDALISKTYIVNQNTITAPESFHTVADINQYWQFSDAGTKIYHFDDRGATAFIEQYDLSTAWDIDTAVKINEFEVTTQYLIYGNLVSDIYVNEEGTKLIWADQPGNVFEYTFVTPYDVISLVYDRVATDARTGTVNIAFKSDGTVMFKSDQGTDKIYHYTLSTPWNVGTLSLQGNIPAVADSTIKTNSLDVSDDGKLLISGFGVGVETIALENAFSSSGQSIQSSLLTPPTGKDFYAVIFGDQGKIAYIRLDNSGNYMKIRSII